MYPNYHLRSLSLWDTLFIPKTPNFLDNVENEAFGTDLNESGLCNGEAEVSFSTNYIKEKIKRSLAEEHNEHGCNMRRGSNELNGFIDDSNDRKKENAKETSENKDDNIAKNNNHGNEEIDKTDNQCRNNSEENGYLSDNNEHSGSLPDVSRNFEGGIDGKEDSKNALNDDDKMQTSTASSTKTITSTSNELELQTLNLEDKSQTNKTGDNPNSEPSTPKGGKFKGHRRTHSSDGSPIKNVMKTTSYSEGMNSSAYYSQEHCEIQPAKVLNNPVNNVRLIYRFLSHDGMMKCDDEVRRRLREMQNEYRGEIRKLQKRVELERQARLSIAHKREDSLTDCSSRRESENLDDEVIFICYNLLNHSHFYHMYLPFHLVNFLWLKIVS